LNEIPQNELKGPLKSNSKILIYVKIQKYKETRDTQVPRKKNEPKGI
jgi:hypothetical protein